MQEKQLQKLLSLSDAQVERLRDMQGTWVHTLDHSVPSALPLRDVIREAIIDLVGE